MLKARLPSVPRSQAFGMLLLSGSASRGLGLVPAGSMRAGRVHPIQQQLFPLGS